MVFPYDVYRIGDFLLDRNCRGLGLLLMLASKQSKVQCCWMFLEKVLFASFFCSRNTFPFCE